MDLFSCLSQKLYPDYGLMCLLTESSMIKNDFIDWVVDVEVKDLGPKMGQTILHEVQFFLQVEIVVYGHGGETVNATTVGQRFAGENGYNNW